MDDDITDDMLLQWIEIAQGTESPLLIDSLKKAEFFIYWGYDRCREFATWLGHK